MIDKNEIEKIRIEIENEFPNDSALQQIHIARKILTKEAELKDMKYLEYIKSLTKNLEWNDKSYK